jgi:hypothetical protein
MVSNCDEILSTCIECNHLLLEIITVAADLFNKNIRSDLLYYTVYLQNKKLFLRFC